MSDEDLIVLCEEAIDHLETKQNDWIGAVMDIIHEIRASLVNRKD